MPAMPAYNFPEWQVPPIVAGTKTHTVRKPEKRPGRHAAPGEPMRLWSGQRTKQARLIGEYTCIAVQPVRFRFYPDPATAAFEVAGERVEPEAFARADGFDDLAHMRGFWFKIHAPRGADFLDFGGLLLAWSPPRS